jgi:hypothetical protein
MASAVRLRIEYAVWLPMNDLARVKTLQRWFAPPLLILALAVTGCPDAPPKALTPIAVTTTSLLQVVDLSDPIRPTADSQPIRLHAARNEWTSFALQVSGVFSNHPMSVRIDTPHSASGATIAADNVETYQILPMPVQVKPGYVRHTGVNSGNRNMPRGLLPTPMTAERINLAECRDPTQPTNPSAHPNGSTVLIWVDIHVPQGGPAEDYVSNCTLMNSAGQAIGDPIPLTLKVYDFALPDERHLQMVGRLTWDRLSFFYPQFFGDTITPSLINRGDPRYRRTIAILDQLVAGAEENRAEMLIPGLHPTVKWPAGEPPLIEWNEFDSLIAPWMSGSVFPDHVPLKDWVLPAAQGLEHFDLQSRMAYWSAAATHFDQRGWLDRSPVWLYDAANVDEIAIEAAHILSDHSKVRIAMPLSDEQLAAELGKLGTGGLDRVISAAEPLVSMIPASSSTHDPIHRRWLATNVPGMASATGIGGDEQDVRAWAWLAYLRAVDVVVWDQIFPTANSPDDPADPDAVIWFYPGQWFGVSKPVPTLQLKWLRRAQQDYEYLWLAQQHGESRRAVEMSRLVTRPVELQPGQSPDPVYSLLSGTASQRTWEDALELLAQSILFHGQGRGADAARQRALLIEMMQWSQPQERPLLLPRSATWRIGRVGSDGTRTSGPWLTLGLGLDIYHASDAAAAQDRLQWGSPPARSGWEMRPQPVDMPALQTYRVQPASLSANFDLTKINADATKPLEISFVNDFRKIVFPVRVRLPIALSERREGPITLDGRLDDWTEADAFQDGPMVLMLNRPDLHKQQLQSGETSTRLYSAWGRDNFYLAFALEGLSPDEHSAHNEVYYEARRAWGEDLSEVLIQPVYADNRVGPVLHVVCKPNGADWVERRDASKAIDQEWQASEGAGIRYATTTTTDGHWRGEIGIPWKLINAAESDAPVLLRFNFSQHRQQTCESTSWCGPVDYGRDENLMGVLYLGQPRGLTGH